MPLPTKGKTWKRMRDPYAKIDWDKASVLFEQSFLHSSEKRAYPPVKEILRIVAAAGAIGAIFMFPGAAVGLGVLNLGGNSYSRWKTKRVLRQLEKQRYVSIDERDDGTTVVKITKRGLTHTLTYAVNQLHINQQKRWDGKWRVVMFDISEDHKKLRDIFRIRLVQLGMYQLQESVYVSPYPCFDEIEFLRALYGIPFAVRYLVAEKLEDDGELRQRFNI